MLSLTPVFKKTRNQFESWPSGGLTAALIGAAIVIVIIALWGSMWLRALTAAYVFLP